MIKKKKKEKLYYANHSLIENAIGNVSFFLHPSLLVYGF